MKKYWAIILGLLFASCIYDPADSRARIVNQAAYEITLYYGLDTIPLDQNHTEFYLSNTVKSNDTVRLRAYNADWPSLVEESTNKKLNLFVYNVDSLKAYNDIDLMTARKKYTRYQYTLKELEEMNWIIVVKK